MAEIFDFEPVNEDEKSRLWRKGKTILVSFGVPERRTGQLIGMWLKAKPDPVGLLGAIQFARDQNVADPVAYISSLWKQKGPSNGRGKQDLSALCFELAAEIRERERAEGIVRPADAVGSG